MCTKKAEVADMPILIGQLEWLRKQAFDREAKRTNRNIDPFCGSAPVPRNCEQERERLNVQYWTETIPMVSDYNKEHGTDIKPWGCVKLDGGALSKRHPYFHQNSLDGYSIAVAIVYDEATKTHKPVHIGDPIWIKNNPYPVNWALFNTWKSQIKTLSKDWTWTPYAFKREFEINGEKFACPEKGLSPGEGCNLQALGVVVSFKNRADRDRVRNAIRALLIDARNK